MVEICEKTKKTAISFKSEYGIVQSHRKQSSAKPRLKKLFLLSVIYFIISTSFKCIC